MKYGIGSSIDLPRLLGCFTNNQLFLKAGWDVAWELSVGRRQASLYIVGIAS